MTLTLTPSAMSRAIHRAVQACAALALTVPLLASAATVGVGETLEPLNLVDQHDRPVQVNATTRLVIFSGEKPVSDWVSGVLASQPSGVLDRLGAVYVSDISGMPALITQMFALPKLRKLPFTMALARNAFSVADLPRHVGAVTVMTMRDSKVTSIQYVSDASQLRQVLGLPPQ